MGILQKKPTLTSELPSYSIGLARTVLIVGLGNLGKQYAETRHNIGFRVVDEFATSQDFEPWVEKKDMKCHITKNTLGETRVFLIKPTTMMNLSGEAVQAVMQFYKIARQNTLVVHDELDIPFGQIRTRTGGSSAGNNGIKSIIQHIGEDFHRMRIGIQAESPMEASDFVLAKFSATEQSHLNELTRETSAMLSEYIFGAELLQETRSYIF